MIRDLEELGEAPIERPCMLWQLEVNGDGPKQRLELGNGARTLEDHWMMAKRMTNRTESDIGLGLERLVDFVEGHVLVGTRMRKEQLAERENGIGEAWRL